MNPFTQTAENRQAWQKWWADNLPDKALSSAKKIGLSEGDCRALGMMQDGGASRAIDPDAPWEKPLPKAYWEWRARKKKQWADELAVGEKLLERAARVQAIEDSGVTVTAEEIVRYLQESGNG
jgi:hypothetical protein